WCEIVAMAVSFLVSVALLVLARQGIHVSTHAALVWTVAVTTVSWLATAYVGPETDRAVLVAFYTRVRPWGPGWAPIRPAAGLPTDDHAPGDSMPRALLGWFAGCTAIWSALFAEGSYLYGRTPQAIVLTVVFVVSAYGLIRVLRQR